MKNLVIANGQKLPNTAQHAELVSFVARMLELHKRSPRTPQESAMVKREIESTDNLDNQ